MTLKIKKTKKESKNNIETKYGLILMWISRIKNVDSEIESIEARMKDFFLLDKNEKHYLWVQKQIIDLGKTYAGLLKEQRENLKEYRSLMGWEDNIQTNSKLKEDFQRILEVLK